MHTKRNPPQPRRENAGRTLSLEYGKSGKNEQLYTNAVQVTSETGTKIKIEEQYQAKPKTNRCPSAGDAILEIDEILVYSDEDSEYFEDRSPPKRNSEEFGRMRKLLRQGNAGGIRRHTTVNQPTWE